MAFTYGFYDSLAGDRKYNAAQMSKLFKGIINDGIMPTIGTGFLVSANTGMTLNVAIGRAWFNGTWSDNDAVLVVTVLASEPVLPRIDVVVLEVDTGTRTNIIKVIKGTPNASPVAPTMVHTATVNQYALAHVSVPATITTLLSGHLTNKVGSVETPFSTAAVAPLASTELTILQDQINIINAGYIDPSGGRLVYVGAQAYDVEPGAAIVNGTVLTWTANISRTGVTTTGATLSYVYLYSNSGVAAIEESTTVPVWNATLRYWQKTGDATRRCIGQIQGQATNTIRKFLNKLMGGRTSEIFYTSGVLTDMSVLSGGVQTAQWDSVSLTAFVPVHATHAYLNVRMGGPSLGDDGTIGVSPIDLGSGVSGIHGLAIYRGRASAAGSNVFFGPAFVPISTAQTIYYRLVQNSGAPTVVIDCQGSRFLR